MTCTRERSLHRRSFGVSHSSLLDGVIPWDSARFLSHVNAVRVRQLRKERVGPNGTTSESKPAGRNAHLDRSVGGRQHNCLRGPVSLPTHSVRPDDDGAVSSPLPTALLVRWRGLHCGAP